MTKEYYKKLIDKYLEEDIFNGTNKLSSVSALWGSDSEINYDDRQELMMYIATICIDALKYHGISKLDEMVSNPLESSTNIDNMIESHDNMIDNIIENLEKSSDSKKIDMNITNILKVKFLKSNETITGSNIKEIDIELDDLIKLISDIENIRGLGKSLHKEAYTGIDYLGNEVVFSSYVVWEESGDIYKYNFDEEWIPLNSFIIKQKRDETIKK